MTQPPLGGSALRVLHVLAPARAGGLESVVVQLASGLRGRGHDVQVATVLAPGTQHDHPVVAALREHNIPVHVLVLGTRDYLGERRAVRALLRGMNAQVLHTHGYRADAVLGDVARRDGRAHVMTLHGFVGGSRRGRFYEWLQIQAARYANGVVAVSAPIQERLRGHGITRNVHLLRNAVAPVANAYSRTEARALLKLPADVPLVGWVGRVSHEKGPDWFVEALARTSPDMHGVFVGDGPELAACLARATQLGVRERLHSTGMVPSASRYLAAFDALALTSRTEGTPMILLEAMWAGVPIVATAVGGVPQLLTSSEARLSAAGNVDELAQAMNECVVNAPRAAARAAAARERVARDFSPTAWTEQHEALYRSVIAG
ncbi:glycosyltransferase family 4 protein [Gemmatimonas sp.]